MSLTGGALLNAAVERLGRLYPGESLNSTEQTDFLAVANSMIDNWSLERLNIPVIVVASAALSNGVAAYTFGAGGTFGTTRFLRLDSCGILVPSAAIAGTFIRVPCEIVSQQKFQSYPEKSAAVQIPQMFYYDFQFPVATGNRDEARARRLAGPGQLPRPGHHGKHAAGLRRGPHHQPGDPPGAAAHRAGLGRAGRGSQGIEGRAARDERVELRQPGDTAARRTDRRDPAAPGAAGQVMTNAYDRRSRQLPEGSRPAEDYRYSARRRRAVHPA